MSVNRPSAPAPKVTTATKPRVSTPPKPKTTKQPAATTTPTSSATAGARKVSSTPTAKPKVTPTAAPAGAVAGATKPRTSTPTPTSTSTARPRTKTAPTKPSPTPPSTAAPARGAKPRPLAPGAPAVPSDPPTRPVAGGASNARTNPTPAGTSAAELDAAVPAEQRDAAIAQQEQATQVAREARRDANRFGENPTEFERQALDNFYDAHPTYVDPATNTVYAASYDPASGDLTLTRNDEPAGTVPATPEEPVAPLSTRDDDYIEDSVRREGELGPPAAGPKAGAKPGQTPPSEEQHDDHDAHGDHPDAIYDADGTRHVGVDPAPLDGRGKPGGGTPRGDAPHVQDTVIVIAADGSRVTTVNTALATEPADGAPDEATATISATDADGALTRRDTIVERTTVEDGGVVVERSRVALEGERVTTTWDDHRVDPNGDRTSRSTEVVAGRGGIVSDHRTSTASAGGVRISDSVYTSYAAGAPEQSVILRSASVDGASRATRYEVGFDAEGFATTLTPPPPADAGGREPLDAWVEEQLGPLGPDQSRPAFGVLRDGGVHDVDGTEVDGVVYVSEIGVRTQVDGVDVFIEGDSIAASASMSESVQKVRESWVGMPDSLQGAAATIDLLQGRSDGDRGNSVKFGDEFHAGASAGGDHMTFWLDNDPNVDTTRHEYGHLTGEAGGAPDEDAWDVAMQADLATGVREDLAQVDAEDINFITSDQPLLSDELGVTGYAEKHLDENGNENDDWAESIAMYLSSREQGGVLQVRGDDGTVETYTFEELFPARAAILDSYYELGPAPEVAPPAFPEDVATSGGVATGKGSVGIGDLGDLVGNIVDGATGVTTPAAAPGTTGATGVAGAVAKGAKLLDHTAGN